MTSHVLIQDLGLKKHSGHHGQWKINENAVRVTITIDGKSVHAEVGDNVLIAARKVGIEIPSMCSDNRTQPNGDCGLCVIEVDGNQAQVKACETLVRDGMSIVSQSDALTETRHAAFEQIDQRRVLARIDLRGDA